MRGRRTDRGANGLLGSTALAWDVGDQLDRRLWRVRAACFWLVSHSWTRQHRMRGHRHFSPIAWPNRDKSIEGHSVVGELTMENVCRREKTCCSRHFGSSLFQYLRVTRHVPFMVWRDWSSWSGDSEVSCGGPRLDRRREPQDHVRAVCGH